MGKYRFGFIVSAVYRLIAWAACEYSFLGRLLKGRAVDVVVDGNVRADALRRHHVSMHDLEEDMRLTGNVGDPSAVKLARLERSGDISVERKPQIMKITIEDGVKIVELRMH